MDCGSPTKLFDYRSKSKKWNTFIEGTAHATHVGIFTASFLDCEHTAAVIDVFMRLKNSGSTVWHWIFLIWRTWATTRIGRWRTNTSVDWWSINTEEWLSVLWNFLMSRHSSFKCIYLKIIRMNI